MQPVEWLLMLLSARLEKYQCRSAVVRSAQDVICCTKTAQHSPTPKSSAQLSTAQHQYSYGPAQCRTAQRSGNRVLATWLMLTSYWEDLIHLCFVLYTFCHKAGQVSFTDGLAAGQVSIAKHDVREAFLDILNLHRETQSSQVNQLLQHKRICNIMDKHAKWCSVRSDFCVM